MIPTLTKPGLAELPPKSAYDKLAFIESHYDELCEMYQTIMEHLKLPQVEVSTGGGDGVKWITHKIELTYVDMLMSEDLILNALGYSSIEEAIKLIPYRSCIASNGKYSYGNLSKLSTVPTQNNNIKPVYMGTNSDGKYIFRYALENNTGSPYGDNYTFYIKKAVRGGYENPTGYISTAFTNNNNDLSYTYEVVYYGGPVDPTLNYVSSISEGNGNTPYYTFTEKFIDDSEVE